MAISLKRTMRCHVTEDGYDKKGALNFQHSLELRQDSYWPCGHTHIFYYWPLALIHWSIWNISTRKSHVRQQPSFTADVYFRLPAIDESFIFLLTVDQFPQFIILKLTRKTLQKNTGAAFSPGLFISSSFCTVQTFTLISPSQKNVCDKYLQSKRKMSHFLVSPWKRGKFSDRAQQVS